MGTVEVTTDRRVHLRSNDGSIVVVEYLLHLKWTEEAIWRIIGALPNQVEQRLLPKMIENELCGSWIVRPGGGMIRPLGPQPSGTVPYRCATLEAFHDTEPLCYFCGKGSLLIRFEEDGEEAHVFFARSTGNFTIAR